MVHLDLIKFKFTTPLINEETPDRSITNILGKSYYIPIDSVSKRKARIYEKNRKAAYYNSRQHFYRSISQDELHENGYSIIGEDGASLDIYIIRKDDYILISGLKGKRFYITYYCDLYGNPLTVSIDSLSGNNIIRKRNGAAAREYDIFTSDIQFLNDQCIIRSTGSSPANSILFGGPIGEKRVGTTLPSNYFPDSD